MFWKLAVIVIVFVNIAEDDGKHQTVYFLKCSHDFVNFRFK